MSAEGPPIDFFVVGAQRGGSTHLATTLGSHPQVFLPGDEVPYYEDPFFARSSPAALAQTLAGARPGQVRGIHCPSYLGRVEVAPRLARAHPEALILAVLRDPVERALSAYCWYVQFGMLPAVAPEAGLARLLQGWTDPAYPQAAEVLDWSAYGRHLGPYFELFGSDRLHVVLSADLAEAATRARLHERLGVDPAHTPATPGRRNPGVYDLRRLRFLRLRSRLAWTWAQTDTYSPGSRRRRRPLRFAANAAVVGVDRLILSRVFTRGRPVLSVGLERDLRSHYAPDVEALEQLLGRDLSDWKPGP